MNKKKLLEYILIFLCLTSMFYVVGVMSSTKFNPFLWSELTRYNVSIMWSASAIILYMVKQS